MEFQPIKFTAEEEAWLASQKQLADEIMAMFAIPAHLIGDVSSNHSWVEYEAARASLIQAMADRCKEEKLDKP